MIHSNKKNNFFSDLEKAILNDLRKPAAKNKKKRNRQRKPDVNTKTESFIEKRYQQKQGQAGYLSGRLSKAYNVPRYSEKEMAASIKAMKFTSVRKFKKFLYYRIYKLKRWYSKLPKYGKKFARIIAKVYNTTHESSVIKHSGKKSKISGFVARYLSILGRLYKKTRGWKARRIKSFIRPSFRFRYFYRYKPRIHVTERRRKYFRDMFSSSVFESVNAFGRCYVPITRNDIVVRYFERNHIAFSNVVGSKLKNHFPVYSRNHKLIRYSRVIAPDSVTRRYSTNFTYKRIPSKFFRFFYLKQAAIPLIFDKSFFFTRFKKVNLSSVKRYYSTVSWYNVRRRCAYFFRKYKLSTKFSLRKSYKRLFSRVFSKKKRFSFTAFFGVFDKLGSVRYRFRARRARYMRSHRFKLRKHNLYSGAFSKNFRRLLRKNKKLRYGIHFYKSVNNIFVNVSTQRGKSLYSYSAGRTSFKGSKRLSPAAAELMGKHVSYVLKSNKISSVSLVFHSPLNYLFRAVLRGLASNLRFSALRYHLSRPHNGLRLRLSRRV